MPDIGKACHELRVNDETRTWRIVYQLDIDAVVILEVFSKSSRATPDAVMESCRKRLRNYLVAIRDKGTMR